MAMGIGMMFNIILPINFNSPYKSTNIQEFWRKWHITLGRFMTNYLYIPLGGNRKRRIKNIKKSFYSIFASGIWHGAGWNFVIWGMLHGICILIHRIWKNTGKKLPKLIGWFITINLVNIFWVFFRGKDLQSAMKILKGMIAPLSVLKILSLEYKKYIYNDLGNEFNFFILILAGILCLFFKNSILRKENKFSTYEVALYISLSIMFLNRLSTFLYFNF